ncbi:MAG: hypothetical protein RIC55_37135 [Pirellulaceae bacterium]
MKETHEPAAASALSPPGPWGRLQTVPIVIAPPMQFVGEIPGGIGKRFWSFPQMDREEIERLLASAELSNADISALLDSTQTIGVQEVALGGFRLAPSERLERSLSPQAREEIYGVLSCFAENPWHHNAFRFCGVSLDDWLHGADLHPQTVALVRRYAYRHGAFLFFADLPLVLPEIADARERLRLFKVLSREATLLLKLHVAPDSDVDALATYWTHGGRHKDIRPILESLAACSRGEVLDVVHLLPPFARLLLYTYPHPPKSDADALKDCHWTSLNFFCEPPDERYLDLEFVVRSIAHDYRRIHDGAAFGDLVILCSPEGEVFHSAVHIADGIAFTKQGPTMSRPWMLMRIEQLCDFYPRRHPVEVRYYRRNDR